MSQIPEQQAATVGRNVSIFCALIGAVVPIGLMLKAFLESYHPHWDVLIGAFFTLTALLIAAAFLGRVAGKVIWKKRSGAAGAILVGICLAFCCLIIGVAVWALFNVAHALTDFSRQIVWFASVMALIVGALPAILLGVLYGVVMRSRLSIIQGWDEDD